MSELPQGAQALSQRGVDYRLFEHNHPVNSLEQAAAERGQDPRQVIRSILFRVSDGNFVMVLAAGHHQISWPALRAYLRQSRITLATREEVLAVTGYQVGAVSPFGVPTTLRILADDNIFHYDEVSIGSGKPGIAIILKSDALRSTLGNIETGNFCSH